MAIDRPLDQAQTVLANDQRQQSPVAPPLKKVFSFVSAVSEAIAAFKAGNVHEAILKASASVKSISDVLGDDHAEYLLSTIISELRWLQERFEQLSDKHQDFLNTDWISLFVDADRKARQTRTREKVSRLARILCNAAEADPPPHAEVVEEMLRLAMYVNDFDIAVLREAARVQRQLVENRHEMPSQHEAITSWERGEWRKLGLTDDEFDSSSCKLQSLGLLMRLQQPNNKNALAPVSNRYLLLRSGLRFVTAVREGAHAADQGKPPITS
jgi:hypothetical protein